MIYVIAMPYPVIWMLTSENFLIDQKERQILGIKTLSATQNLAHLFIKNDLLLYMDLFYPKENNKSEELEIKDKIEAEIKRLMTFLDKSNHLSSSSLGYGFSASSHIPTDEKEYANGWKEIVDHYVNTAQVFGLQNHVIEKISLWIQKQQIFFDLDLNIDPGAHQLAVIDCQLLPEALALCFSIFYLRNGENQKKKNPEENAALIAVALTSLQDNLSAIQKRFQYLQQAERTGSFPSLGYAQAAFIDYQEAIEDYIKWISIPVQSPLKELNVFNDVLEKHQQIWGQMQSLLGLHYENFLYYQRFLKWICLLFIILTTINTILCLVFRVLSRHLWAIYNHIQNLAKGNYTKCFCSDAKDEFGPVGLAFDKMGRSVQNVVSELKKLGRQLTDSIEQITTTAKEQEEIVSDQEKNIEEIEQTAKLIANNSRDLANTMNELSLSSKQSSLADEAKSGLDQMHGQMSDLAAASTNIISTLAGIQNKVASTKSIVAFMGHVSDQARLLSLNAAIETTNVGQVSGVLRRLPRKFNVLPIKRKILQKTFNLLLRKCLSMFLLCGRMRITV